VSTILVVDDEPAILELLVLILREEGYTLVSAGDGTAAIAVLERGVPDLVVADVMMPRLGGLALVRRMRADPALAHIPILLTSAAPRPALDGLMGIDFLAKPFALDTLLATVRRALAPRS
jgi:CheY-like chemotaxis protein